PKARPQKQRGLILERIRVSSGIPKVPAAGASATRAVVEHVDPLFVSASRDSFSVLGAAIPLTLLHEERIHGVPPNSQRTGVGDRLEIVLPSEVSASLESGGGHE